MKALPADLVERAEGLRREGRSWTAIGIEAGANPSTLRNRIEQGGGSPRPASDWEPACMEPDDLASWRAGEIHACQDCTVEYSDLKRAENRCNGVPGELLAGAIHEEDRMDQTTAAASAARREVRLAIAMPCGTCSHEEVCAIRQAIGDVDRVTAGVPAFHSALTVELTATVSCSKYLKARIRKADRSELEPRPKSTAEDREARAARVLEALERHGGDRRAAAAELGMPAVAIASVANAAEKRAAASPKEA